MINMISESEKESPTVRTKGHWPKGKVNLTNLFEISQIYYTYLLNLYRFERFTFPRFANSDRWFCPQRGTPKYNYLRVLSSNYYSLKTPLEE